MKVKLISIRLSTTICPKKHLFLVLLTFVVIEAFGQSAVLTGTVADEFGKLPGARVVLSGTTYSTNTDVNGWFAIEIDPGVYKLNASFVMYLSEQRDLIVNANDSIHLDIVLESGFSVDQLVSLGSRAKPRSLLETTVPVDVISPQQISNSSQIELSHILHYLTPSFHSVHQTISDGTDFIDPSTLRGLGPDQVLVLVNGKRRHNSALLNVNGTIGRGTVGTDFNAIPVAAVDRIEILRDGAASQYGSDAIAGVVNIILKDKTGIIDVDNRIGVNTQGDGFTAYSSANYGLEIGDKGFINLTAEYRTREATNRAGNYTGSVYVNGQNELDDQLIRQNGFFDQIDYENERVMQIGNASTQNLGFFFNGVVELSKNASFYGHGGRNFREGSSHGFYRFPKDSIRVVHEIHPNGFSPEILANIQDQSLTLGVKGKRGKWNLDFSNSSGSNTFDYTIRNSNNASLGVASPQVFYAGGFMYSQNTTNLDVSRTLDWLDGVNLAFGTELRAENYQIIAGEEASWVTGDEFFIQNGDTTLKSGGVQVFPGFQPENELNKFRTNNSWYIDIETNITERFLIELASRYQLYNDFGGQNILKLAARYRVDKLINFRAGYATGFRAPSLHQVFFNNISTQFVDGEAVQVGTFNNESAVANAFSIASLKPELSRHFSLGFTSKFKSNLSFTFDYYYIDIQDRIVLSGQFAEGYESILAPLGVGAAQFFTNAIDSRTEGADAVLFFKRKIGSGNLETSLAANFTRTRLVGKVNVSDALIGQEDVLYNREEISRVESAQPNFKISSVISFKKGKVRTELRNTMFGRVKYIHPDDGDRANWKINTFNNERESRDQDFSPKVISDLSLSIQMNDNIRLGAGGNNILNIYPDQHNHSENVGNGNFVYSRRVQQFGVKGAYYYGRLLISL